MRFEFATATRILFGPGSLVQNAPALKESGHRPLVVTGSNPERHPCLFELLARNGQQPEHFAAPTEPTVDLVERGCRIARESGCDGVIGIGGGSAIDTAKAIAGLLTNEGSLSTYLEVIGGGQPLSRPAAPFVAVPTTSGAGAEVTRNAVITSPEHKFKASLRSPHLLARLAIIDPELTLGLPPAVTASTGLDALTQLIEPFVSCRANPLTDGLCREGMARAAKALRRACDHGDDLPAREEMALASWFSGMALANAGLGAVHGFAAPIGGSYAAPHGAVCAALLPHVMAVNLGALRQRQPASQALTRYEEIARLLTGRPQAAAEDGILWVGELCAALQIPPLRQYGIEQEAVPTISEKAATASSMKGNPLPLLPEELQEILTRAI